ncbi:MAG: hypothetical protein KAI44_07045 [Methylococcales bacterium]|nr:hypothetical protein [Methylococcales bacterium]
MLLGPIGKLYDADALKKNPDNICQREGEQRQALESSLILARAKLNRNPYV